MVARAPRKRMYRTMQGRMVDIEKLRAANENVQAVGNMNVNARGDIVGPGGVVTTKKETIIKKYYEQPKGKVDDTPIRAKPTPAPRVPPQKVAPMPKAAPKIQAKEQPKPAPKKGIEEALDGLE